MPDPREVFKSRRAVLMDLDGTLYCNDANAAYVREVDRITGILVQERYGLTDPQEAFAQLMADQRTHGWASKTETMERLFGIPLAEQNRHRERHTKPGDFLRPDPRLLGVLEGLASSFHLLLGTNNAPGLTRSILDVLRIPHELFGLVLTSEDLGAAKPDPTFFEGIARESAIEAEFFVSVGDREDSDLAPARRLGMATWLVRTIDDVYRLDGVAPCP